jgi:hypothetical protein
MLVISKLYNMNVDEPHSMLKDSSQQPIPKWLMKTTVLESTQLVDGQKL